MYITEQSFVLCKYKSEHKTMQTMAEKENNSLKHFIVENNKKKKNENKPTCNLIIFRNNDDKNSIWSACVLNFWVS